MKGAIATLAAAAAVLIMFAGLSPPADAATYTINWTFGSGTWPSGKSFSAGDVIVFKYSPSVHNVVAVGSSGYRACSAAGGTTYSSGNDQVTLAKGANYFICGVPGHCQANLKMTVNAS